MAKAKKTEQQGTTGGAENEPAAPKKAPARSRAKKTAATAASDAAPAASAASAAPAVVGTGGPAAPAAAGVPADAPAAAPAAPAAKKPAARKASTGGKKSRKQEAPAQPQAQTQAQKPQPQQPQRPAVPVVQPLVDTTLAAASAARMLMGKVKVGDAPEAGVAPAAEAPKESGTFKQLKESLSKPHVAALGKVLGSTFAPKNTLPIPGRNPSFHSQTQGGFNKINVPRRTGG